MRNTLLSREEIGTTSAEYAVCTGAAVGFGTLLWKFITSDAGQQLLAFIFKAVRGLIGF